MLGTSSVKAGNVEANPNVALHWRVTEVGDDVDGGRVGAVAATIRSAYGDDATLTRRTAQSDNLGLCLLLHR